MGKCKPITVSIRFTATYNYTTYDKETAEMHAYHDFIKALESYIKHEIEFTDIFRKEVKMVINNVRR